MRQIRIFLWLSKVICQFVWLFPCFVRVGNPFVNLKLHFKNLQKSKQKQFHVQCSIHKSYKTQKWTSLGIRNFEENMDLSLIYLAVYVLCASPIWPNFIQCAVVVYGRDPGSGNGGTHARAPHIHIVWMRGAKANQYVFHLLLYYVMRS